MQFQWHEGDAGGGNLHILRSPLLAAEESRTVLTFWHWLSRLLWKPATKVCVVVSRNFQRIAAIVYLLTFNFTNSLSVSPF